MSCFPCTSGSPSDSESDPVKINRKIDKELLKEKHIFRATHRLLLLGAGESGKSTIVKQMRILHVDGYSEAEKREKIKNIRGNLLEAIQTILDAMETMEPPVAMDDFDNWDVFNYVKTFTPMKDENFPQIFYDRVIDCWTDKRVQATFERSNEYQLFDSAQYFLDKIDEIRHDDYLPTEQDILRCRVMTTGIREAKFEVDKVHFHMLDVGGQRSARKMWFQCFHDVTAIVFVCSSSSYNLVLSEDSSANRLTESLALFEKIWTNKFLVTVSIILFLNKQDVFAAKIKAGRHRLETYFPEFDQFALPVDANYDSYDDLEVVRGKYFIRHKFLQIAVANEKRQCYPHFTCAVESDNIRRVFNDCRDIVMRIQLEKIKFL